MLKQFTNKKGFTLIELLIVVAIIGILAAIAIPQFNAYRQRGYNSAAVSDLRNMKTAQEALQADQQTYGSMQGVPTTKNAAPTLDLTGAVVSATGQIDGTGPVIAATQTAKGAFFGNVVNTVPVGSGFALSNGVLASTNVDSATPLTFSSATRHDQSDTAFFTEAEQTQVLQTQENTLKGKTKAVDSVTLAVTTGVDITAGSTSVGSAKWLAK